MVNRIIIDEETAALKSDKELVASGGSNMTFKYTLHLN